MLKSIGKKILTILRGFIFCLSKPVKELREGKSSKQTESKYKARTLNKSVCLVRYFTSQSTIFQSCGDEYSWFEPVLSRG